MQFVKPMLFQEAVDKLGDRTSIGSDLSSGEWADVPLALRERAFFSSRVESVRFLDRSKGLIGDFLEKTVETLPNGDTVLKTGGRARFVEEARRFALGEGMGPLDPKDAGGIKDITSQKRLELIFDTQTRQAQDYGYWRQGQDPDVLELYPAQRLVREQAVKEEREWHQQFEGEARLKSDVAYWISINQDFGVPWGPWGWGCGHDVEDVDRAEAEALGLIAPGEAVQPADAEFNQRLEASTRNLDPDLLQKLADSFGDQIEIGPDFIRWAKQAPRPNGRGSRGRAPRVTKPKRIGTATLESVLKDVGLDGDKPATPDKILRLRDELKEENPLRASQVIKSVRGSATNALLSDIKMESDVQAFVDYVPADKLRRLPKLNLSATRAADYLGEYRRNGEVNLSEVLLTTEHQRRRTTFHELMHWLHLEGDPAYKAAIKSHFAARTAGEQYTKLTPYRSHGKRDKWYEPYAGRIYPQDAGDPEGLEVPTRYIEWLVMDPKEAAGLWNDPVFRETMVIVLRALF